MRTLVIGAIVLALTAGAANAAIVTDPNLGALKLALIYDLSGNVSMKNLDTGVYTWDSYEINSTGADLDPTQGTGWRSIQDWVVADALSAMSALGSGCLQFGELGTPTTSVLAEGNLSASASLPAGNSFSIGKPFPAPPVLSNYTFYYAIAGDTPGTKYLGVIELIPEPATIGLLALGACAALIRRRRG